MATKEMKALKDFRYRTRMLRAGDPVEMDHPAARFYAAVGAVAPADGSNLADPPLPRVKLEEPKKAAPKKKHAVPAMTTKNIVKKPPAKKRAKKR